MLMRKWEQYKRNKWVRSSAYAYAYAYVTGVLTCLCLCYAYACAYAYAVEVLRESCAFTLLFFLLKRKFGAFLE